MCFCLLPATHNFLKSPCQVSRQIYIIHPFYLFANARSYLNEASRNKSIKRHLCLNIKTWGLISHIFLVSMASDTFRFVFSFPAGGHLRPQHDMNQAPLMTVLIGFTLSGEVLCTANDMHSTGQIAQLRASLAGGGERERCFLTR